MFSFPFLFYSAVLKTLSQQYTLCFHSLPTLPSRLVTSMPALPNYLLAALANLLRAAAQYCDELAHNNIAPTTQDNTCRVTNCSRSAIYLGRCAHHPHADQVSLWSYFISNRNR
jgi:hypothetical protein